MLCLAEDEEDLRARIDRLLVGFTLRRRARHRELSSGHAGSMLALLQDALMAEPRPDPRGRARRWSMAAPSPTSPTAATASWPRAHGPTASPTGPSPRRASASTSAPRSSSTSSAAALASTRRRSSWWRPCEPSSCTEVQRRASIVRRPTSAQLTRGLPNLEKHVENIGHFGQTPVVALNRFASDADEEIDVVRERCAELGVPFAVSDHHARGGEGAVELARAVVEHADGRGSDRPFQPLYSLDARVEDKILSVARAMYGAAGIVLTPQARRDLRDVERHGYAGLPCASRRRRPRSRTSRNSGAAPRASKSPFAASRSTPARASSSS